MTDRDDTRHEGDELEFVHRDGETEPTPPPGEPADEPAAPADDGTATAAFAVPRRRSGPPWVMIGAGVVIVAVAAWIFWPRGGGSPGVLLDDQIPLVTSDSTAGDSSAAAPATAATPRSSDVNLGMEVPEVVPEQPADDKAASGAAAPRETPPARAATPASHRTPPPAGPAGERPVLSPGPEGKWAVQVGAFGSKANADRLAAELRDKGLRALSYRGDTARGTVWKVWIGYFPTREETVRWLEKHRDEVGRSTYITHR